ncbi:hypothetical protein [Deinococcus cellulosilyticus]|uniref:Uncharacterized protein n=1 Tax=Deinococcus cellulosilyticus (strain DSM 18568 / NBRC 106333 / KACC 11606 / 5516J-15) TaxID=1223518 RepID=A0A511N0G0_DEIC1|nr:hypothetical protein [Deinococcus cellulosilyticus]GEM46342.1 hypothetical protein DC3_19770 [Deinococcus cellulosilyticus NBRC 106333 = KACC 11606]
MPAQTVARSRVKDRDFILVVKHDGSITTLRLRDIAWIDGDDTRCRVTFQQEGLQLQVHLREGADAFRLRCEGLKEAIDLGDCVLINQHFAPQSRGF